MLLVALVAARASAQVPFVDGLYERWSPLFDAPSGVLARTPPPALIEWVSVTHEGDAAIVTFEPERRVVWRITYGPHGATSKRVVIDGEEVLVATYERDAAGHLVRKHATGSLLPSDLTFDYTTDPDGRVTRRTRRLADTRMERVEVSWDRRGGATVTTFLAEVERRRDRFDAAGRLLESTFLWQSVFGGPNPPPPIREQHQLIYVRDRAGALTRVVRVLRGRRSRAAPEVRDTAVIAADLRVLAEGSLERSEVRLLLGSPVTSVDRGRGHARELEDRYTDGCWMNETDSLAYDASGLYVSGGAGCICGFCVEASQPYAADDAFGTELHWTRGPWLRLDGELVITAEHELVTPTGPRRADALRVGDLVLGPDGAPFAIRSIETLDDTLRLGRNVETDRGTFSVGRFVVISEPYPMACPTTSAAP